MKFNNSKSKEFFKKCLQKIRLRYLAHKDVKRFSKSAALSIYDATFDQLSSRIMYNVHAIEKGLSREHHFRKGFGRKALSTLNDCLLIYEEQNYSKDRFAYKQGRSIILRYIDKHKAMNEDTSFLSEIIVPAFLQEDSQFEFAGVKTVFLDDKKNNKSKNFYELSQNRASVRDFSGEAVDSKLVLSAIKNALKTPSVCNRQGWKVYLTENKTLIKDILYFQKGFNGYPKLPEILLTVCVSNSSFLSPVERNEAFVDGGLLSMSIIYGLEYEGLACVTLNAMMDSKSEKQIRKIVKIDSSEQVILFIAIGQFKDKVTVPVSDRKSLEDVVKII